MDKCYKLEFYVPETHVAEVKAAVFDAGGGRIGNYDNCCWQCTGTGQFRPCPGSNPFIGSQDVIEEVTEIKVELICSGEHLQSVIAALKQSHPYETPAFQYWPVNIE